MQCERTVQQPGINLYFHSSWVHALPPFQNFGSATDISNMQRGIAGMARMEISQNIYVLLLVGDVFLGESAPLVDRGVVDCWGVGLKVAGTGWLTGSWSGARSVTKETKGPNSDTPWSFWVATRTKYLVPGWRPVIRTDVCVLGMIMVEGSVQIESSTLLLSREYWTM